MSGSGDTLLNELAVAAGLQVEWRDAHRQDRVVSPDSLRVLLDTLGLPCGSEAQCRESLRELTDTKQNGPSRMTVVRLGAPVVLRRQGSLHYRLHLEDGKCIMGTARDLGGGMAAISDINRPGYHRLEMGGVDCTIAVVPSRCPSVQELQRRHGGSGRAWVLGAQIYSLRRSAAPGAETESQAARQGGVTPAGWEIGGDFSLLRSLARRAGELGAAGLAISPVHAMFTSDPDRYSPYSPSSRLFLNAMYADPGTVFDDTMLRPLIQQAARLDVDANGCMDWPAIQARRLAQFHRLFDAFDALQPLDILGDFLAFRREGGDALERHACYEALHAQFSNDLGPGHGWQDWPAEYRDPASDAVRRYAREHERDVRFHAFLQWLAARSLADAQACARCDTPLGLIADLAIGTDPRGSHAWSRQDQIMSGVSVGAPPDLFQPDGQDWGLTAFSPRALQQSGYQAYIETLQAVLAYAGGLRVDHAMGLARMWLVPTGARASEGAYLQFPRDQLMDLLALEAWRHDAVVVGENLGTVPEDFNEAMDARGMLGMSVLWFEQEEGDRPVFRQPKDWAEHSMAMITTHDLPTVRGWWAGRDIAWRERQQEYDAEEVGRQLSKRNAEKEALWLAMQQAGIADVNAALPADAPIAEIMAYVAGTPSAVFQVSLEDALGLEDQPNLPGGCSLAVSPEDAHPNWRRVLDATADELLHGEEVLSLLSVVRRARQQTSATAGSQKNDASAAGDGQRNGPSGAAK